MEVEEVTNPQLAVSQAELSAVTAPTVLKGLGYPMNREEISPEPTGWIHSEVEIEKVSRETSR